MKNPWDTSIIDKIKWRLFGEWNFIYTLGIISIIFWVSCVFVIGHFIHKYW